jgi:trigger factor
VTEVKEIGPFERLLTVTIDAETLAAGRRSAARRLSSEAKIKGFRPGKAPLKVVESIVGAEKLDREAVDEALPKVLASAITEAELRPVVYPMLRDIRHLDEGAEVDVLITMWPTVERLPDYEGRRVSIERHVVGDEDVDAQVDRMREQFAELDDVEREGFDGDYVLIDVKTSIGGEDFAAGSANDMLYEIGSGSFLEGMDDALRGAGVGRIVDFDTTLPEGIGPEGGRPATVRALVKGVKSKRLPELTDEWVEDVSEFGTLTEMREKLAEEMQMIFDRSVRASLEQQLLQDLVEDLDLVVPDAIVSAEMESLFHRFVHRLEQQGVSLEQYLSLTGQDAEAFTTDLRSQADANVRTRVLLESVAEREALEVEPDEFERELTALAAAAEMPMDEYRAALTEGGHDETLSGDILRRKAIDRLMESVVPVDSNGDEIELPDEPGRRPDEASDEPHNDRREPAEVDE